MTIKKNCCMRKNTEHNAQMTEQAATEVQKMYIFVSGQ